MVTPSFSGSLHNAGFPIILPSWNFQDNWAPNQMQQAALLLYSYPVQNYQPVNQNTQAVGAHLVPQGNEGYPEKQDKNFGFLNSN